MVWYSHLFKNYPQFVVIHTVKGFGVVNKAKVDVFLELSCFPDRRVPAELGQESQASSCKEEWNSACLSSYSRGDRQLVELCLELYQLLSYTKFISMSSLHHAAFIITCYHLYIHI